MFPPVGGPAIVDVIEGKRSGGAYQEILLGTNAATPGQNRFHVTVSRNAAGVVNPYPRIVGQMRSALPGIRMSRSPFYVQNRYGPFGYAVGHGRGRDLCLYGWQSIRTKASPMTNQGSIEVRLRLCESGATEQKLLSVMYGYTIDVFMDSTQWNPFGTPLPPAAELGKRGADIYPAGAGQFATVTSPIPAAAAETRRPASQAPQVQLEPPAAPQPVGPRVPLPPAEAAGGTLVPTVPAPAALQAPPVPLPPEEE